MVANAEEKVARRLVSHMRHHKEMEVALDRSMAVLGHLALNGFWWSARNHMDILVTKGAPSGIFQKSPPQPNGGPDNDDRIVTKKVGEVSFGTHRRLRQLVIFEITAPRGKYYAAAGPELKQPERAAEMLKEWLMENDVVHTRFALRDDCGGGVISIPTRWTRDMDQDRGFAVRPIGRGGNQGQWYLRIRISKDRGYEVWNGFSFTEVGICVGRHLKARRLTEKEIEETEWGQPTSPWVMENGRVPFGPIPTHQHKPYFDLGWEWIQDKYSW